MKKVDINEFNELIKEAHYIKPKLKRELKFGNSIANLSDEEWDLIEMLPIYDKSGNHGVLMIDFGSGKYLVPFDLSKGLVDATGKTKPIICDFCRTWRPGSQSGSIIFPRGKQTNNSIGFLCCGDLKCSMNARNKTEASLRSKTQVREDITLDGKITRLQDKIFEILGELGLEAIILS